MTNQEYQEAVERNLEGIEAVSTGVCPGCETCAHDHGYWVEFTDDEIDWNDPNAEDSRLNMEQFEEDCSSGEVVDEGDFSSSGCGICDSPLGGTMRVWHGIINGEIHHWNDACVDCVLYLANGDLPNES